MPLTVAFCMCNSLVMHCVFVAGAFVLICQYIFNPYFFHVFSTLMLSYMIASEKWVLRELQVEGLRRFQGYHLR